MASHVAVLVLDTPIAGVAEDFGDFGDNVRDLLKDSVIPVVKYQIAIPLENGAARDSDVAMMEKNFAQVESHLQSGVIKAIVLTGSRSDAFESGNIWLDRLNEFIQSHLFTRPNFPVVGLCFGHQVLAKNLGCKVNRSPPETGWEIGTTTIALNKSIMSIEKSPFKKPLTLEDGKVLEHINLVEFHRDIVYGLPPTSTASHGLIAETSFQNFGSTNKCSIQGLVTESGPIKILTFQGHPEFITSESLKMLEIKFEQKLIDKATFERLTYNTKNLINQGPIIAKVINNFIESYQ